MTANSIAVPRSGWARASNNGKPIIRTGGTSASGRQIFSGGNHW